MIDETILSLADYADRAGKSLRTVQRWLADGELPDARQDDDGRWWVPAAARRRRTSSHDVVAVPSSYDVVQVSPRPPVVSALGAGGTLDEAAAALGFSATGLRRLYADMQASPGLPLYVGRYGPHGALRVYAAPTSGR